jgi:hypothetical protein
VRAGAVDFAQLDALDDAEVIRRLTRVKGIGPWTVHMFLIFALRLYWLKVEMEIRNAGGFVAEIKRRINLRS